MKGRTHAGPRRPFEPDSRLVAVVRPAVNVEPRAPGMSPDILLMHYTGFDTCENAVRWLEIADSRVSCHYVIDVDGTVIQMVPEALRAWHAGLSVWRGVTDINSCSIGIEIQNPGHDRGYPDFPAAQIDAVIALSQDIIARHGISPERVLAHSDIAPHRKIDPGEKFDWARLARAGVGHWVTPALVSPGGVSGDHGASGAALIETVQRQLQLYGYGLEVTGEMDERTTLIVKAFQRHFRPARVDGIIDHSTADTLRRLLLGLGMNPEAIA